MLRGQKKTAYNIQWSFLVYCNKLSSYPDGFSAVIRDGEIMRTIITFLDENAGFYVQSEAKDIVRKMISTVARKPDF